MKTTILYITLVFVTLTTHGQESAQDFISIVDTGYTTRWDVEQNLGDGKLIENQIVSPEVEHSKEAGLVHYNGLLYQNLGVLFTCTDDGELIDGIHFLPPFTDKLGLPNEFIIGSTPLSEIMPIDSVKFSTTGASKYFSFVHGQFQFYVLKPEEDMNKDHWSHVPKVADRLDYYSSQPIAKVTTWFYDYDNYKRETQTKEDETYCSTPFYAPKNETHLNCYTMTWPNSVPGIMVPFYAMTGGQKSDQVKQGLWKEYWPSHKLKYTGEFEDGKEVGEFKYFDINGNLTKTENFKKSESSFLWYIFGAIGIVGLILIIKRKKRHTTKAINHVASRHAS